MVDFAHFFLLFSIHYLCLLSAVLAWWKILALCATETGSFLARNFCIDVAHFSVCAQICSKFYAGIIDKVFPDEPLLTLSLHMTKK